MNKITKIIIGVIIAIVLFYLFAWTFLYNEHNKLQEEEQYEQQRQIEELEKQQDDIRQRHLEIWKDLN